MTHLSRVLLEGFAAIGMMMSTDINRYISIGGLRKKLLVVARTVAYQVTTVNMTATRGGVNLSSAIYYHTYCHEAAVLTDNPVKGYIVFYKGKCHYNNL